MTGAPTVLCVGAAVHDYLFSIDALPEGEGKLFANGFREAGGGPAATGAVAVARLGGRAILFARAGRDGVGDRMIADLQAEGVETDGVLRLDGQSTVSAVLVDRDGRRIIVSHRDPSMPRGAEALPLDRLEAADCVLADLRWGEGAARVLRRAAELGLGRVLDADQSDDALAPEVLMLASHIVFSRPGLSAWSGIDSLERGLSDMRARTGAFVAVTDGERGCTWLDGATPRTLPAVRVDTVDTTGAGDVFHGAFALALARRRSEAEALRFAAAAAALKCTRPGGREGIPTAAQLTEFMERRA